MKQKVISISFAVSLIFGCVVGCVHNSPNSSEPMAKVESSEIAKPYFETEFQTKPEQNERFIASAKNSGYKIGTEFCGTAALKFPRVQIDMRKGYCAGLVFSEDQGLIAPRTIVQIPKSPHFVLVDFGGWVPSNGRVFLVERTGNSFALKLLLSKLDYPHGSAVGPDGKVYVATSETIFRFNPLASDPKATIETVVRGLPGMAYAMPDGRTVPKSTHPLKAFVFDKNGAIYVNVGGPSDACLDQRAPDGSCFAGESTRAAGAIWKITPQAGRMFKTLAAGDPNPPMKVFVRGLRNSVALLAHPSYPDTGTALLQGENARDFKDPSQPHEELNSLVEGRHYGWPYCYNNEDTSPEYLNYLASSEIYRGLCINQGKIPYEKPYTLLPPHAAPLDMKYYSSSKFPELKNTLIMTWHGHEPTGARIVFAPVDAKGFPIKNSKALGYNRICDSRRMMETSEAKTVEGVQFEELVTGWHGVGGKRPRGAPVGLAIADDGAIWVADDKSKSVIRIDATSDEPPTPLPCDTRTPEEIAELVGMVARNPGKAALLADVRRDLVEKHCVKCHTGMGLADGMTDLQKDQAVLAYFLQKDSWVFPANPRKSRIYKRTHALDYDQPMPPNARDLLATDQAFRDTIAKLSQLIRTMVDGDLYVINTGKGNLNVRNELDQICGSIPDQEPIVVLNAKPVEKPKFVRIYPPPKEYLGRGCAETSKYYVSADFIKADSSRTPAALTEDLFVSRPFTERHTFTFGIEGPAVDSEGRLFVVNYKSQGTIGVVDLDGSPREFLTLPKGSVANSLQITPQGDMFVADYKGHHIFKVDLKSKKIDRHVANVGMSQPNDMALTKTGVIYASDPDWKKGTGRVWRVSAHGEAKVVLDGDIGTVNGLDLSPDEKTLYIGDSKSRKVWAYEVKGEGLGARHLVKQFDGFEIDGIKVDSDGNLYVARIMKGTIAKITPSGSLIREIKLNGAEPTNLTFGGPDKRTIFVTQRDGGFVESFRVDSSGR